MDWLVVASIVPAVGGLVTGIVALYQGQRQAKASEQQLEVARLDLALVGRVADEARGVAEQANELAQHANQTAELTLRGQLDQQIFDWRVECEGMLGKPVGVVLHGTQSVRDVTVIVTDGNVRVAEAQANEVAPMTLLPLELESTWNQHIKDVLAERGVPAEATGGYVFFGSQPKAVEQRLCFLVGYRTQSGVLRSNSLEYEVAHRNRGGQALLVDG